MSNELSAEPLTFIEFCLQRGHEGSTALDVAIAAQLYGDHCAAQARADAGWRAESEALKDGSLQYAVVPVRWGQSSYHSFPGWLVPLGYYINANPVGFLPQPPAAQEGKP